MNARYAFLAALVTASACTMGAFAEEGTVRERVSRESRA